MLRNFERTESTVPNADRPGPALSFDHVAIQTADLDASIEWYRECMECELVWRLDAFSDVTRRRLPGIVELVELSAGNVRLHLFTRGVEYSASPSLDTNQFQHVCLCTPTSASLQALRARWLKCAESGLYRFARAEPPTEILVDSDGHEYFYAFDINGIEYEFTYYPGGSSGNL